jgi:hypothetical protein
MAIWWENVTGRILDGADINGGTATNPMSTWRNVVDSELRNCTIRGVRLRTASDHVEGLKIDLATRCKLYRCTFSDNDIMHLFFSYRFWTTESPRDSNTIRIDQCRFDTGHVSYGLPFYFHVQVNTDARPVGIEFHDCEFRAGPGIIGGPPAGLSGVKFFRKGVQVNPENHPRVPVGAAWPDYPGTTPPPPDPDPEPGPTVEQRLTVLEALVAEFSADLAQGSAYSVDTRALLDQRVRDLEARIVSVDSRVKAEQAWVTAQDAKATGVAHDGRIANLEANKATRPAGLDVENVNRYIAAIIAANPKIAAALVAERDALIGLFNALRA